MKFTIASKSLLSHLSAVSKVVSQKNTIAILDNFLFTIKDNMLIATGTDKENTITARMELLECEGEGSVAVNVKRMLELLKECRIKVLCLRSTTIILRFTCNITTVIISLSESTVTNIREKKRSLKQNWK